MVLKAAVVFIAGGLIGSGITALTRDEFLPVTSSSEVATAVDTVQPLTDVSITQVDSLQAQDQAAYIRARFAVQRPFAALHPPRR